MKKLKIPGDNISLKTKKTESAAILDWLNSQTNLMDSIRFLIENEIQQNGIRNLQQFIPSDRNISGALGLYANNEIAATAAVLPEPVPVDPSNVANAADSVNSAVGQAQELDSKEEPSKEAREEAIEKAMVEPAKEPGQTAQAAQASQTVQPTQEPAQDLVQGTAKRTVEEVEEEIDDEDIDSWT
ncbi:hypothetical protein [Paenibacillus eucommiae]|uniref:Uncharacterized protein n=1 Tax=Paenibacillus eucommiae TaxID=1355755 RepID=A0ABS4IX39_9BACL|nr:hypothetical protein [Paenibacillus eucommiae]MBP1991561.1 hypothetical protein [Paenibacillus eucommiae]